MTLTASSDISWAEVDGVVVILDLRTESYFALDGVAAGMWHQLLTCGDIDKTVSALASQYAQSEIQLKEDLQEFVAQCMTSGFLSDASAVRPVAQFFVPKAASKRFLTVRAWWALFATVWRLSRKGFSRTYREYVQFLGCTNEDPASEEFLEQALRAFGRAENFFLIQRAPKDCVPRSLALFRFLRCAGLPVEHRIGVNRFPFRAHAWVQYKDKVIRDQLRRASVFTTIARIGA